eukprot:gnl/TRDRNA2_/TRDRNA2_164376_c0_seq5.p2 gnl/TRDRNA2_/TRDRNA2_164376_c0~~gnl/TRDRNA2_/TRDRNA2_164376_c0_seq5.p2  ORF type:complete len:222 (+),score=66.68 gnl/TRDRNA2_/TRDRNA2_164376_c0_seq5:63-728(+)
MPPKTKKGAAVRARTYGNAAIDSLPDLVQEWYHAIGTPFGVGSFDWAKECVKKGVDVNARLDTYGGNALFLAIEQCNMPMIEWLVEEVKIDLSTVDYGGYNALDYAAACKYNVEERPPVGYEQSVAAYLKSQGLEYTWFGAALAGDVDKLLEFLDNGQDINERGGHFNRNACQEAIDNGHFWIARLLMTKGAAVGIQPFYMSFPEENEVTVSVQGKLKVDK